MSGKISEKNNIKNIMTSLSDAEGLIEYKLKTILKHTNMSLFDYDIQKDTVYVVKDAIVLHGFTDYWFQDCGEYYCLEHLTERLPEFVRSSFLTATRDKLEEAKQNTSGELIVVDVPVIYKEGNTRWTSFVLDTLVDENGNPILVSGYCKDIHEQKKELYRLQRVAQTDFLTGLRNKSTGMMKIQKKIDEDKKDSYFIAVLDLDKFKEANDIFGHSFGDLVLKEAAETMQGFLGHEAICCRTGGDEFMLFRACDGSEEAMQILSDLKGRIARKIYYQGSDYDVSASIGFSIYPVHGTDLQELYDKADMAMYRGKKNHLNVPALFDETKDTIAFDKRQENKSEL